MDPTVRVTVEVTVNTIRWGSFGIEQRGPLHLAIWPIQQIRHEIYIARDRGGAHEPEVAHVHVIPARLRLRPEDSQVLTLLLDERIEVVRVRVVAHVRYRVSLLEDGVCVEQYLIFHISEAVDAGAIEQVECVGK
jgi:hypothetical protein